MPLNNSENKESINSQGKNDAERQEEISQLRKLLEIKEKELKTSQTPVSLEKEILNMREKIKVRSAEDGVIDNREYKEAKRETIREGKKEAPEQHFEDLSMARKAIPTKAQIKKITREMKDADIAHQLIVLVDLARFQGVYRAISVAKKLGNIYLLDRLHDAIVSDLYEELIKAKKLRS